MKSGSLQNKTAIITGGNKNLGKETAIDFAERGANLVLHYHSSGDNSAETLADELTKKYNVKVALYQGNLIEESAVKGLFDVADKEFGGADFAINNVGKVLRKNLEDVTTEEYDSMFEVNTKAAFLFLREAAKRVKEDGSVVMLTTSLLGAYTPGYSLYQGAKSAVHYMVKALSKETTRRVSFNSVSPGPMDTPFLYGQETPERIGFFKTQSPHNRLTEMNDIVPIIRFLCAEGTWITGQNIFANNGFVAP